MILFLFPIYNVAASEEVTAEDIFKSTVLKYYNDVEKLKYNQVTINDSNLDTVSKKSYNLKQFLIFKIRIIQQRRAAFNLNPRLLDFVIDFHSCIIDGQNAIIDATLTETYQYRSSDVPTMETTKFKFFLVKESIDPSQIRDLYCDDPIGELRNNGGDIGKLFIEEKQNILNEKEYENHLEEPKINFQPMSGELLSLNRSAMVNYAHEYAYKRPSLWGDFDAFGGDCTNFVSQVIYAGTGGVMDSTGDLQWYYNGYSDRSPSWTSVSSLYSYLTRNTGRGPQGKLASTTDIYYSMQVGDVIQIDFNSDGVYEHSTVIVKFQTGYPTGTLVAAHTNDVDNKLINDYSGAKRWIHLTGYER